MNWFESTPIIPDVKNADLFDINLELNPTEPMIINWSPVTMNDTEGFVFNNCNLTFETDLEFSGLTKSYDLNTFNRCDDEFKYLNEGAFRVRGIWVDLRSKEYCLIF